MPAHEGKSFQEIFAAYASRFMDDRQIAKALMLEKADLDRKCMEAFGMNAKQACDFYRGNADSEVRDVLWNLMITGNTAATKIYSEYIAEVAQQKQAESGGVKVVINVPVEDDDAS